MVILFLGGYERSGNGNTDDLPIEIANAQDTSCYQLTNGGQIHDVSITLDYLKSL